MSELERLVGESLYENVQLLEDGGSIVREVSTGVLYLKKILSVYNISVFTCLKGHPGRYTAQVHDFCLPSHGRSAHHSPGSQGLHVMVTEDGSVKIIDFDAAKIFTKSGAQDTILMSDRDSLSRLTDFFDLFL